MNKIKVKQIIGILIASTLILGGCSGGGSSSGSSTTNGFASDSVSKDGAYASNSVSGFGESSGTYDYDYDYDSSDSMEAAVADDSYDESYENEEVEENTTTSESVEVLSDDKLVYRCNMSIETLDYDKTYTELMDMLDEVDGIIQSEEFSDDSSSYMYSYNYGYSSDGYKEGIRNVISVRIPSKNYKSFIRNGKSLGNVTALNSTVENITQQYYEKQAQVDAYETQIKTLQNLLTQATEISDMMELTSRITQLEAELNYMKNDLRTMDMDTAYSYVTITLKEVMEYSEYEKEVKDNTFMDRLVNTINSTWANFLGFCEALLFFIIAISPFIVVALLITRIFFWKKVKNWRKNKKQAKERREALNSQLNSDLLNFNPDDFKSDPEPVKDEAVEKQLENTEKVENNEDTENSKGE